MKDLIEHSTAYNSLDPIAQKMITKRKSRLQIEDAVIQARTIGVDAWRNQSPIPDKWKKIVEEII